MAKILICGVPYGYDNVGDEAILASIVAHLRRGQTLITERSPRLVGGQLVD